MQAQGINLYYGNIHALKEINLSIREKKIVALIGPSGCGKTTFLRTLNRMNDLIPGVRISGEVSFGGLNVYGEDCDVVELRKRVGMVFHISF